MKTGFVGHCLVFCAVALSGKSAFADTAIITGTCQTASEITAQFEGYAPSVPDSRFCLHVIEDNTQSVSGIPIQPEFQLSRGLKVAIMLGAANEGLANQICLRLEGGGWSLPLSFTYPNTSQPAADGPGQSIEGIGHYFQYFDSRMLGWLNLDTPVYPIWSGSKKLSGGNNLSNFYWDFRFPQVSSHIHRSAGLKVVCVREG